KEVHGIETTERHTPFCKTASNSKYVAYTQFISIHLNVLFDFYDSSIIEHKFYFHQER
ncbi:MAG: hypothetical protein EXX96DRAFT_485749, partial [Benjaminiella poitrasii]